MHMTLQVLPPEMLEQPKDRIEKLKTKPHWKPSSKDGESEELPARLLRNRTRCHGMAICIRVP